MNPSENQPDARGPCRRSMKRMKRMKPFARLLAALFAAPVVLATAQGAPEEAAAPDAPRFIRLVEDDAGARLQTAVARYVSKDGVEVDLVGAVHIADAAYFEALNKRFAGYEAVLYEMLYDEKDKPCDENGEGEGGEDELDGDGEGEAAAEQPAPPKDPLLEMVAPIQLMAARFLKLENQKDGIDYDAENFIHADLTLQKFLKLQSERGESLVAGLIEIQNAAAREDGDVVEEMSPAELFRMIREDGPEGVKLFMARQMQTAVGGMSASEAGSVIIGARNEAAIGVLDRKSADGVKRMAIFYGAAHLPDFEARLADRGFERRDLQWETAWTIRKAERAEPPQNAENEREKPAA